MDFEDRKLLEIGNYAKGWYGDFTGAGEQAFKDLAVILGDMCGLLPEHVERKQIFLVVDEAFRRIALRRDPENNWMHRELIIETFYPPWPSLEAKEAPDAKMLNKMLRIIAQVEVKFFPGGVMYMDARVARLFPNGEERIAKRKEFGFEIVNA